MFNVTPEYFNWIRLMKNEFACSTIRVGNIPPRSELMREGTCLEVVIWATDFVQLLIDLPQNFDVRASRVVNFKADIHPFGFVNTLGYRQVISVIANIRSKWFVVKFEVSFLTKKLSRSNNHVPCELSNYYVLHGRGANLNLTARK